MRKKFGGMHADNMSGHAERVATRQDARVDIQGTTLQRRELKTASKEVGSGFFPTPNKLNKSIQRLAKADGFSASKKHVDSITKAIMKARTFYGDDKTITLLVNAQAAISSIAPGTSEKIADKAVITSRSIPSQRLYGKDPFDAGDQTDLSNQYTGLGTGPLHDYFVFLATGYPDISLAATSYETAKTEIETAKTNLTSHISSGDVAQSSQALQQLADKLTDANIKENIVKVSMHKFKEELKDKWAVSSKPISDHDAAQHAEVQKFHQSVIGALAWSIK
jgi:hypothetical protein